MKRIIWRLGADLGANSLGWAAIELDALDDGKPIGILAAGSRIFSDGRDPKSGASLAVDRRDARAMRRRRDRFQQRQRALLKYLVADGLFPEDEGERKALAALDPYALRARALDEVLSLHELGRALFHLNQRRGFKSNRKADRKADDDPGKIADGIENLKSKIREAEAETGAEPESWTFGKWLHDRRVHAPDQNNIPRVRTRLGPQGEDAKDGYDFYPSRLLLEQEFAAIWEAQAPHYPDVLTENVYKRLFEIVFNQRPLKAPRIGKCTLIPGDERLPKAHPLFQRRRLLEELNALMIVRTGEVAQRLTHEERNRLLLLPPNSKGQITFDNMRKALKTDALFNKESENRTFILGDEIVAQMASKKRFHTLWHHLSVDQQWDIITRLRSIQSESDDAAFCEWLGAKYDLTPEQIRTIANTSLPEGFGRFGRSATERLIEALANGVTPEGRKPEAPSIAAGRVIVYSEAVVKAGFAHHSDLPHGAELEWTGEKPPKPWQVPLPYYGVALERHIMPGTAELSDSEEMRVGRLTNPTVHIGLNQLRRVCNILIRKYGPPAEIAIELARELKLTDEQKREEQKKNNRNRLDAEQRSQKLLGQDRDGNQIGQLIARDTGANRALLKLWEELNLDNCLDRCCPYSGERITIEMLFSANGVVEVDHILPFSATLDDSNANKTVCVRAANQIKRKRSPYDARNDLRNRFGTKADWEAIAARAAHMPKNKRWRFEPDAMEKFENESGFLARHLKDTQYLSRLSLEYLGTLYPEKGEGSGHIWVSPGRLTEMVRRKLGLNDLLPDHNFGGGADQAKNRLDHRHHAIDAVVVAIVDRGMLNRIARASGQEGAEGRERIIIPEPWDGFRDDLRTAVNAITVSHRTDHGTASKAGLPKGKDATAGRLHNDTAYGFTGETDAKGNSIVVRRVPLSSFKKLADIDRVRDPELKAALYQHLEGLEGKAFDKAISEFGSREWHPYGGVRRVRVTEPLSVIPIRDRNGHIYKGYKGDSNYRYDVWELPGGKWVNEVVSMFDAHQPGWQSAIRAANPTARKVLSLHRDDVLAIERNGAERELVRVVKFSEKQFAVAPPNEGGALKARDVDKGDPFKYSYPSPNTLKALRARQVRIDELGRVLDPCFPARSKQRKTRKPS